MTELPMQLQYIAGLDKIKLYSTIFYPEQSNNDESLLNIKGYLCHICLKPSMKVTFINFKDIQTIKNVLRRTPFQGFQEYIFLSFTLVQKRQYTTGNTYLF